MDWIPWDSVLATGHTLLDTDHQHLVDLFHQLAASVTEKKGTAVSVALLDKVIHHARVHFAFEELLMLEQGYPKIDQHKAEHARLINQALKFKAKFEANSSGSHIALVHFPEDWLTFHIFTSDKDLADFLLAD